MTMAKSTVEAQGKRGRGNFFCGLAGPWVIITQFSLSGVHGYSNDFKCVFLRDYCVSLR